MQRGLSKIAIVLIAGAVAHAGRFALADDFVGDTGNPAGWEFVGNKTFTAEELREGITRDPEVQRAASPTSNRFRLLNLLEEKLSKGYLANGFEKPEISATTRIGGGGLKIEITEGARYLIGDLVIHAPESLDVEKLKQQMRSPQPGRMYRSHLVYRATEGLKIAEFGFNPKGTQIVFVIAPRRGWRWKPEDYFHFDMEWNGEGVAEALADEGYFSAEIARKFAKTADGRINVEYTIGKLGPKAVVGKIDIAGLKISTPEKFLAFLKIKEGEPITLKEICNAQMRLRASGRFIRHELSVALPEPGKVSFNFTVEEVTGTPPLDEPLSASDQTALKFAQWTDQFRDGDDALTFTCNTADFLFNATVHPKAGFAFTTDLNRDAKTRQQIRVMVTPKDMVFDSDAPVVRYAAPTMLPMAEVELIIRPREYRFKVGAGNAWGNRTITPISVVWDVVPSAILELMHRPETVVATKGGEFSFRNDDKHLVIDAKTGRLISWRSTKDEGTGPSLRSTQGRFDEVSAAVLSSSVPNEFDAKFPFGSALSSVILAGSDRKMSPEDYKALREILHKTLSIESLELAGPFLDRICFFREAKFAVPLDNQNLDIYKIVARNMLPGASESFEYGSWPWTISREFVFQYADAGGMSVAELGRVVEDKKIGPIGCLIAGVALDSSGRNGAGLFAELGLKQINAEAIAADMQALFPPDRSQTAALKQLLANLGMLDQKQFEILSHAVPDEYVPALKAVWEMARTTKHIEHMAGLSKLLAQPAAKSWLEAALKRRQTLH